MTKKSEVRVGLVQMTCGTDPQQNLDRSIERIRQAAADGAQLIAFPETWLTGYPVWLDEAPGAALWDSAPATAVLNTSPALAKAIADI